MKRKIFSILFALVLVLSFSLVTAVPAAVSANGTTQTLAGSTIEVTSLHLCNLGAETEDAFNNEPEALVVDDTAFDAQTYPVTIEGEVTALSLGAGWVDTAYVEIGLRPEATMNARNAGVYLIALNTPTKTQIHLQDYTGGGRSGGVIEIDPNSAFRYKVTLLPSDTSGGTATLKVWVGEQLQKEAPTLDYGYASTWQETVAGDFNEDFSNAHLFYSIIADRRGDAGQPYSATVGDVTINQPSPTEVWVDDDWSSQADVTDLIWGYNAFQTIQNAIDAATTTADDTIIVLAGSYPGGVMVYKDNLTIVTDEYAYVGYAPFGTNAHHGGFEVAADDVTIQGFEIVSGYDYGILLLADTSGAQIRENYIFNYPIGIANEHATTPPGSSNNLILGNCLDCCGVGIYMQAGENNDVVANDIYDSGNADLKIDGETGISVYDNYFGGSSTIRVELSNVDQDALIPDLLADNYFNTAVTVEQDSPLLPMIWGQIQPAVDAASSGDTVSVLPGSYRENVTINKGDLTLLGAKNGIPAGPDASPADRGYDESFIEGSIRDGGGVGGSTIDGFTIWSEEQHGITLGGEDTVVNNIMEPYGGPTSSFSGIWSGGGGGHFIAHNNIRYYQRGMMFDGDDVPQFTVTENYITGSSSTGIILMGSLCNGHVITNNLIEENSSGMVLAQGEHLISGNRILNNDGSGIYILASPRTYDIEITNNLIAGNGHSIYLDGDDPGAVNNVAHFNDIVDNGDGLYNGHTATFDATYNWWGTINGPTHAGNTFNVGEQGDAVTDNVLYVPWLDGPFPEGAEFAPVGSEGYLFSSIQAAINAATHTTVTCVAGTYTENVVILPDKDGLQLIGAGSSETFITPASGKPVLLKGWSMLSERPLDGVRIQGFSLVTADNSHAILAGSGTPDDTYYTTNLELEDIVVDGSQRGIGLNAVQGVTLTNVHLSNISGSGEAALELTGVSNLLFTQGSIVGNDIGVRLQPTGVGDIGEGYGLNGNIQIHFTNFCGNSPAIENQDSGTEIDATNNWWCHTSGPHASPGYGDPVGGNVLYNPWLLGPYVPGDPLPTTFDKTLALNIGWTLVSTDNWVSANETVGENVTLALNYTPSLGWFEVTPTALVPVDALYLKTEEGSALGIIYSGGVPAASSKDLEPGWNLISSATLTDAKAVLSPLRYVQVGDEQGVALTTLVSQGNYNQHTGSFYLATLDSDDWNTVLVGTMLNPFDGYWVYMNAAKSFGVIPE